MLRTLLIIAVTGAAGAMARFGVTAASNKWLPAGWPHGTLLVNVTGSLVIGMLYYKALRGEPMNPEWLAVGIGFLGAYTTFSAFSLDTFRMLFIDKAVARAMLNIAANVCLSIGAVGAGAMLMRRLGG